LTGHASSDCILTGCTITGATSIAGLTVTSSFTATGLVTNADLANNTISGIALGNNLDTLTFGSHLAAGGSSYNGSAGVTITSDATNANTASTIVARDGSGNFSAGTITASLTGGASLDLPLAGGTMSGNIAMGGNNITGGGTVTGTTLTGTTALASPTLTLGTQGTTQGSLVLDNTASTYATTIQSSNSATAAWTMILPVTAGTNGYVLSTNGGGVTSWIANGSGGSGCTISGSQYQIVAVNSAGTGCTPDANATVNAGALALGASGTLGSIAMGNATTGVLTLQPQTGALGTVTVLIPAASDTLVNLAGTQTLTNKSIDGSEINSGTVAGTYVAAINLAASGNGGVTGNLSAATGGTGVANNAANTITFTGNYALGLTLTGATSVTLPTSGTLATTVSLATGSSTGNTLTGRYGYFVCTSTCTVTPPVPAAGYQFCVMNDDDVSTVITLGALGSSSYYEKTARTGYGTAGTGTLTSGGAVGDMICIVGRDSTHYLSPTYVGTWTAS